MILSHVLPGHRRTLPQVNRFQRTSPWVLILAALLSGCGDSSTTGPSLEVSIDSPFQGSLTVGDQAQLEATLSDPSATGTLIWSSTDTAVAWVDHNGFLRAQRPGTATVSVGMSSAEDELPVTVVARPGGYTAAEIDYLQEIAFGFEFGTASEVIRKWDANPRIRMNGIPTNEDMAVLQDIVSDLNALMEEVQVELVESDPSVEVHYAPLGELPNILSSYVAGNWGYFSVWFDGTSHIYRTVVLLASDVADQDDRNHLAREEITQMLGLAKDSNRYSSSIFYQSWTTTPDYLAIDEALIEMLYRPQLKAGMGYRTAVDLLRTMTRRGWTGELATVRTVPGLSAFAPGDEPARTGRGGVGSGGEGRPGG